MPRTLGIAGIRKNHTISTPWIVKSLLYVWDSTKSPCGVSNSIRINAAAKAAIVKKIRIVNRYSNPMRLWSVVSSHERTVVSSLR